MEAAKGKISLILFSLSRPTAAGNNGFNLLNKKLFQTYR